MMGAWRMKIERIRKEKIVERKESFKNEAGIEAPPFF